MVPACGIFSSEGNLILDAGSASSGGSESQDILPLEMQNSLRFAWTFTGAADASVLASSSGEGQRPHFLPFIIVTVDGSCSVDRPC